MVSEMGWIIKQNLNEHSQHVYIFLIQDNTADEIDNDLIAMFDTHMDFYMSFYC